MRTRLVSLVVVGLLAVGGPTGCGDPSRPTAGTATKIKIGVILPDSKSSSRWEVADRKYLKAAFKAAGVDYEIQNAQGDKQQFQRIADQMMIGGVNVLMIVNLDSGTGKAVTDKAIARGIKTIDYDRLTIGGNASYYVSFDNVRVGRQLGEGLIKCITDKGIREPVVAELHGSRTDNNATEFKQGYDSALQPKFKSGDYILSMDKWIPAWDIREAGLAFEQMLTADRRINAVLPANDDLANAAITILKKYRLNGKVPVVGQDATAQGLRNILLGDQCMTVYKAVKREADAAVSLAVGLAKGKKPAVNQKVKDPTTQRDVPAVLLEPKPIYASDVKDVVDDGYVAAADLCAGAVAAKCAAAGIR